VSEAPPPPPPGNCGKGAAAKTGDLGNQTISADGAQRTYDLYLPASYDGDKTYPLVLVFHGDGGTGGEIRGGFGVNLEKASGDGAIFAYPDGENETWSIDDVAGIQHDLKFVDAVIASLSKDYCVDTSRVFLTGFSKGAYFVNQAACRTKSTLRGIATDSGGGPYDVGDLTFDGNGNLVCTAPDIGAMQVQGASDGTVPPDEGHKARDYWKGANGCNDATSSYAPSPCVAYQGCKKPEVYCEIPGMGHQIWSNAATTTWKFFTSL
jgi:polyhydroxybutyrate depolymerase